MKYQFEIKNKDYQFQVVKFNSFEKISELYEYDIELISESEIDDILQKEAVFYMKYLNFEDKINGIIIEFEEISKIDKFFYYKIKLVPKMYKLALNKDSEVFLNKSLIEIFEDILKQHMLSNKIDYEFRLVNEYEKREYVTQYLESDFNFLKRWCEKLGIYFYFEQNEKEKIVFIDNKYSQKTFEHNYEITYSPISGIEGDNIYKSIQEMKIIKKEGIKSVKIKDYNPNRPDYNLEVTAQINKEGRDIYIYEEHFQSQKEGQALAQIIGESYDIEKEVFYIKSTIPNIYPAYNYLLTNYYKEKYNNKYYTVIEVKKEGSGDTFLNEEKVNIFISEFKIVDANKQYRSLFKTSRPKIDGVLLAKIDGETEKIPYIDEEGRYKVIMPFITTQKENGKASCWIRLLQPTGGGDKGFHFPLKKGSEIAVTFVHGNPDRPVILGALPNPNNPNLVSLKNATQNIMQSQKKMKIIFDDKEKNPSMTFSSHTGKSYIKIT